MVTAWSICLSNKNHHFRALLVSYQVQTAGTEEKSRGGAGNRGEEQGRSRKQRRGAREDLGPWGFSLGRRPTGPRARRGRARPAGPRARRGGAQPAGPPTQRGGVQPAGAASRRGRREVSGRRRASRKQAGVSFSPFSLLSFPRPSLLFPRPKPAACARSPAASIFRALGRRDRLRAA